MTYQERQELNRLSKECFGTASRWSKIVAHGVGEKYSRDREVVVPTSTGMETKVFTDSKMVVKHYTAEEVRALMEQILAGRAPTVLTPPTEIPGPLEPGSNGIHMAGLPPSPLAGLPESAAAV